jgi:hypothetical protein
MVRKTLVTFLFYQLYTIPELFDSEQKGINTDEETIKLYQEIYAI